MPRVGSSLALIAVLAAAPRPLPAQERSLPQRIADVIVQLNGGIHTGFRFMHATGVALTGTFTPAPGARSISTAAHLTGAPVPVTIRFSDGTGVPTIPDTDTRGAPRGMNRKTVALGTLSLTAIAPENEKLQRELMYNPIFLTSGIQPSDDPMIALRSAVYALSVAHRH